MIIFFEMPKNKCFPILKPLLMVPLSWAYHNLPKTIESPSKVNIWSTRALFLKKIFMMFWSVGPFWYMVYGIWYVVYGMKISSTMYSHMFRVLRARAVYNVVHLFLVTMRIRIHIMLSKSF